MSTAAALPKIDNDAVEEFTCGQCHALALAIHEETKLPLAGIWRDKYEDWELEPTPDHVVVVLPDSRLLDIEGPGAENRWVGAVRPFTPEEVMDFQKFDYHAPDMGNAKRYAQAVLKQYGIQKFTPLKRSRAEGIHERDCLNKRL